MAAVTRRQFHTKLNVIPPQEVQWKPPLRQAAGTLGASRDRASNNETEKLKDK